MEELKGQNQKITYGPVPSRRLGRSLGIDLLPYKTCCFDCVYCQLGPTRKTTIRRRAHRGPDEVVRAVRNVLDQGIRVDTITFSGSGEPTLDANLGDILKALKRTFSQPIAVITNGALLFRRRLRDELALADIVLPSLDGWTPRMFLDVNRPHPSLSLERIIWGLAEFRKAFRGEIWLELMLVHGLNDSLEELPDLIRAVDLLDPHRIQINTVTRPPAESWVRPVEEARAKEFASALGPRAEVVASFKGETTGAQVGNIENEVAQMVSRRPLCAQDLSALFGIEPVFAAEVLEGLAQKMGWEVTVVQGRRYYRGSHRGIAYDSED